MAIRTLRTVAFLSLVSLFPGGKRTRHRITWTPNDGGSVRQFRESTDDNGAWSVAFDGRYTRRKATP
jgi:hypothetical protein